jgi:hypothetical protein
MVSGKVKIGTALTAFSLFSGAIAADELYNDKFDRLEAVQAAQRKRVAFMHKNITSHVRDALQVIPISLSIYHCKNDHDVCVRNFETTDVTPALIAADHAITLSISIDACISSYGFPYSDLTGFMENRMRPFTISRMQAKVDCGFEEIKCYETILEGLSQQE